MMQEPFLLFAPLILNPHAENSTTINKTNVVY